MTIPTEWTRALMGGALIGASASVLMLFNGRVAGISGIVGGLVHPTPGDAQWRAMFVAGLLLGGMAAFFALPEAFHGVAPGVGTAIVAGLLVGAGTRVGNGCTSGHGVCGISRRSGRSLVATLTFIATGAIAVALTGGAR